MYQMKKICSLSNEYIYLFGLFRERIQNKQSYHRFHTYYTHWKNISKKIGIGEMLLILEY